MTGAHSHRHGFEVLWLIGALAFAALAIDLGRPIGPTSFAGAAASDAGDAALVVPSGVGAGTVLTEGGSATDFTVRLPEAAACSGDSANEGYRVHGFMVPSDTDLTTLNFGSTGPISDPPGDPAFLSLYTTGAGSAYANAQTANANPAGGPGPIINIPAFDFEAFLPGDIDAGVYAVGIACTVGPPGPDHPDKFWQLFIEVTAAASDEPAGFTWAVADEPEPPGSTTTTTTAGGSTTTSTTLGSGSTTTSTTAGSGTTTSTTDPGVPVAGGDRSVLGSAGAASATPSGQLPRTGSDPWPQVAWAFSFVCGGRALMLSVRKPAIRVRARR